ncbi:MAG: gas vesicle protein GvpG [Pseudomonadota bacterium]
MGLLKTLIGWPVLGPAHAAKWAILQVHDAAYNELYDPDAIKRQLIELETKLDDGEISEEAFEAVELELLHRLKEIQNGR